MGSVGEECKGKGDEVTRKEDTKAGKAMDKRGGQMFKMQ